MSLTGVQIQQLQDALLRAFDESSLRQMVRMRLDEDLASVAGGSNLSEIVFELIKWAERTGLVEDLIAGASVHNPHNSELSELVKQYYHGPGNHASAGGSGMLRTGDRSARNEAEARPVQPVATQGGAYVGGSAVTGGGDFIGRDKIVQIERSTHYHLHDDEMEKPLLPYEPETLSIPAGSFVMGCDRGRPEEAPQLHINGMPEFRIGKYPVTNRQYFEFVRQTHGVVGPSLLWDGNAPRKDKLNHPVTGVTWYEALAYCRWLRERTGRDYRLPSEAQWEKAARGTEGPLYPWGDDWAPDRCNHNTEELMPVDTYPAQNEYGCFDMVGNAREWTSTLWGHSCEEPDPEFAYPWANDGRDAEDAPSTVWRVYRGGRFREPAAYRCTTRGGFLPNLPGPKRDRHGFRIALLPMIRHPVRG